MKAHLVDAMPVAVEAVEHGGLAVRLDAPFDHLGRTAALPQRRQSLGMAARTSLRHRIDERAVAAEQVHILEPRRLVEPLVRVEPIDRADRGHLAPPQSSPGRRLSPWPPMASQLSRSSTPVSYPTYRW